MEFRLVGLLDANRRFNRVLYSHPGAFELDEMLRANRQAGRLRVDDGVEGSAEGDVGANLARSEAYWHGRMQDERRHVDEADALDPRAAAIAANGRARLDSPGRCVEDDDVLEKRHDEAAYARHREDRDHAGR